MNSPRVRSGQSIVGLFALGVGLAAASAASAQVQVTYLHTDGLGSPIAATDAAGNLIWRESYAPFGQRLNQPAQAAEDNVWYTGHAEDADTGLTYAGARYYDSNVGRFLSVDPVPIKVGIPSSFSRFAYANNNPYRFVDPSGGDAQDAWNYGFDVAQEVTPIASAYAGLKYAPAFAKFMKEAQRLWKLPYDGSKEVAHMMLSDKHYAAERAVIEAGGKVPAWQAFKHRLAAVANPFRAFTPSAIATGPTPRTIHIIRTGVAGLQSSAQVAQTIGSRVLGFAAGTVGTGLMLLVYPGNGFGDGDECHSSMTWCGDTPPAAAQ